MYQFNYKITEKDYFDFNYYHLMNNPENKKLNNFLKAFLFIAGIFILIINIINQGLCFESLFIPIILFISGIIFLLTYDKTVTKNSIKRVLNKQKKSGKLAYSPEGTITFDDTSITDVTATTEEKVAYTEVEMIAEGDTAYYFYINIARAYIVPKRLFDSEEQKNSFLEFLNSKCKNLKA